MALKSIQMEFAGQASVNPRLGRMVTTDGINTITAPGYLNSATASAGIIFLKTDLLFASYSDEMGGVLNAMFSLNIDAQGVITLVVPAGGEGTVTEVLGTDNEIGVLNGTTIPQIFIVPNPIIPGTAAITIPSGSTAQRHISPDNGEFRYNSQVHIFEGYQNGAWHTFAVADGFVASITGTANQIDVDSTIPTNPILSIATNPILPGNVTGESFNAIGLGDVAGAGTIDVVNGSTVINGNSSQFLTQLGQGSSIKIAGVTYTASQIISNGSFLLTIPYAGITASAIPYFIDASFFTMTSSDANDIASFSNSGRFSYNSLAFSSFAPAFYATSSGNTIFTFESDSFQYNIDLSGQLTINVSNQPVFGIAGNGDASIFGNMTIGVGGTSKSIFIPVSSFNSYNPTIASGTAGGFSSLSFSADVFSFNLDPSQSFIIGGNAHISGNISADGDITSHGNVAPLQVVLTNDGSNPQIQFGTGGSNTITLDGAAFDFSGGINAGAASFSGNLIANTSLTAYLAFGIWNDASTGDYAMKVDTNAHATVTVGQDWRVYGTPGDGYPQYLTIIGNPLNGVAGFFKTLFNTVDDGFGASEFIGLLGADAGILSGGNIEVISGGSIGISSTPSGNYGLELYNGAIGSYFYTQDSSILPVTPTNGVVWFVQQTAGISTPFYMDESGTAFPWGTGVATGVTLIDTNNGIVGGPIDSTGTVGLDPVWFTYSAAQNNAFLAGANGAITSGQGNVGINTGALIGVTSGDNNIGIGVNSLASLDTGNNNIALGETSLVTITGDGNVGIGGGAGATFADISNSVFVGFQADSTDNSISNLIAIGHIAKAGDSGISIGNQTGGTTTGVINGIFIGNLADASDNGAINPVAIGSGAKAGVESVSLGLNAGNSTNGHTNAFFLGTNTDALANGLSNIMALGTGAQVAASNTFSYGNGAASHIFGGTTALSTMHIKSNATSGTMGSKGVLRLNGINDNSHTWPVTDKVIEQNAIITDGVVTSDILTIPLSNALGGCVTQVLIEISGIIGNGGPSASAVSGNVRVNGMYDAVHDTFWINGSSSATPVPITLTLASSDTTMALASAQVYLTGTSGPGSQNLNVSVTGINANFVNWNAFAEYFTTQATATV